MTEIFAIDFLVSVSRTIGVHKYIIKVKSLGLLMDKKPIICLLLVSCLAYSLVLEDRGIMFL